MAEEIALALIGKVTKAAVKREQKVRRWNEEDNWVEVCILPHGVNEMDFHQWEYPSRRSVVFFLPFCPSLVFNPIPFISVVFSS